MATVYVLDADHGTKIGMSAGDGTKRLASYRTFGHEPTLVRLFVFETAREARGVERLAHRLLRPDRKEGEWFWSHPLDAVTAVHRAWRAYQIIDAQQRNERDPFAVATLDKRPLEIAR
jgi:hypothetical protein